MAERYQYVVIGGGLTGASAVEGIRLHDAHGSIVLIGNERFHPYHRPPLTKSLWFGKKQLPDIFVQQEDFYTNNEVELALETTVTRVDAANRLVEDSTGRQYPYEKLLLATGGIPRRLEIPGGDLAGISYYRYLVDYLRARELARQRTSAVVVGGGFIGSEIAAALNKQGVQVTMVFREPRLVSRVFPEGLGDALTAMYRQRGITIFNTDTPASIEQKNNRFITHTKNTQHIESDMLIVGVGITPWIDLAQQAGLEIGNGITVNEFLQTSDPQVYAAGDNAFFPYQALGQSMRVEHWDHALNSGQLAGENMAGARKAYTYMPYFFSDLFEFGYEAVGDVNTKLETFADWQEENKTGVIYYLKDGRVRGVMNCNIFGQLDAARDIIRRGEQLSPEQLRGRIRPAEDQAA